MKILALERTMNARRGGIVAPGSFVRPSEISSVLKPFLVTAVADDTCKLAFVTTEAAGA